MAHLLQPCLLYLAPCLALGWSSANAQPDEASYFSDLPVVLTASRLPQALDEAPGAVTVIDRDLIRATGYRDLARLMRLVPGIQSAQTRSGRHWVSYHGLSPAVPSGIQVLVDGRSVYTPASLDGLDWGALPVNIDEVERIEIVRGPNPVSFGANAFMGSINIITRDSALEPGSRIRVNAGEPGIFDMALSSNRWAGPLAFRLDAALSHDDGFEDLHDQSRVAMLAARADIRPTVADQLVLRLGGSSAVRGEGYANSMFSGNPERNSYGNRATAHVEWTHTLAAGNEWRLDFYRNWERLTDRWTVELPAVPGIPVNRDRLGTRDNLEFHHRFPLGESGRLMWGGEYRVDRVDAPFLYAGGQPPTSVLRRLFADAEWKIASRWQIALGGAAEQERQNDVHFSPRAFLNWHAGEDHSWRVGYSSVLQQREAFPRYSDVRLVDRASGTLLVHSYMPNPSLRQTRFDSAELGYFGRFRTLGITLDGRLFRERATDFSYPVSTRSPLAPALGGMIGTTQYQNYPRPVVLVGLEYELKARPWKDAEMRFAHTLIQRDSGSWVIDHLVAPYAASLSWVQHYGGGWSSTLTALRMGPSIAGDIANASADSLARVYTAIDARLAYAFTQGGRKWEASLNAINLGGRHTEMAGRIPVAGGGATSIGRVSPMVFLAISGEI